MCEIQFVMSDTLGNDNVNNFIEMLSKGSKSNDDATGIFSDAYQWKIGKAYEELKDKKDDSIKHVLSALPSNWLTIDLRHKVVKQITRTTIRSRMIRAQSCIMES